jgi:hypothetical protein
MFFLNALYISVEPVLVRDWIREKRSTTKKEAVLWSYLANEIS